MQPETRKPPCQRCGKCAKLTKWGTVYLCGVCRTAMADRHRAACKRVK